MLIYHLKSLQIRKPILTAINDKPLHCAMGIFIVLLTLVRIRIVGVETTRYASVLHPAEDSPLMYITRRCNTSHWTIYGPFHGMSKMESQLFKSL